MRKSCSLALALAVVATMSACDGSPTSDNAGTISMLITDAPGDFTRAVVTIDRVELLGEDADSLDGGDRIVLLDDPWTGDLLELSNDVDELVGEVTVPGGSYNQLRFVISGGCIEVETEDGSDVYASDDYTECGAPDGDLHMPSFGSSGLKVNLPAGFRIDGDHRIVLVDFDVAESFGHQAGHSGRWVMHPIIHATDVVMTGSLEITVAVADSVELPRELTVDSFMVVLDGEPPVAVIDGVASLDFLVPGTYSIDLVAPADVFVATDPVLPLEVEIQSAGDADVNLTITAAL